MAAAISEWRVRFPLPVRRHHRCAATGPYRHQSTCPLPPIHRHWPTANSPPTVRNHQSSATGSRAPVHGHQSIAPVRHQSATTGPRPAVRRASPPTVRHDRSSSLPESHDDTHSRSSCLCRRAVCPRTGVVHWNHTILSIALQAADTVAHADYSGRSANSRVRVVRSANGHRFPSAHILPSLQHLAFGVRRVFLRLCVREIMDPLVLTSTDERPSEETLRFARTHQESSRRAFVEEFSVEGLIWR